MKLITMRDHLPGWASNELPLVGWVFRGGGDQNVAAIEGFCASDAPRALESDAAWEGCAR
jgi:hypothetical protein